MKVFYVLLAIFGLCHATHTEDSRIIGGLPAKLGAFPYQVSIRTKYNIHNCGGSIISLKTILTAAHCLAQQAVSNTIVYVGTVTLNTGGTRYNAEYFIIHPEYFPWFHVNDVALIILAQSIVIEDHVSIIPLGYDFIGPDVNVDLTGWGATSHPSGGFPNQLQYLNVKTIDTDECKNRLATINPVFDSEICTFTRSGQGACNGDSGGPLAANGVLVGVVSWGYPCALGFPDVFSRVSTFADWIDANKE